MAKRVAAGVKAAWVAAKKDFVEAPNTENLKQDVVDLLDFARHKASQVKRASDSSSKSLSTGGSGMSDRAKPRVNGDVGAELLTHFKDEWTQIHCSIENSSAVTGMMYSDLQHLNMSMTQSHVLMNKCREEFSCLSEVIEVLAEAQTKVNQIGELVQNVEQAISDYSLAKAKLENERRKHSLQKQHEKLLADNRTRVEQMNKVLLNEVKLSVSLKNELENKELQERQKAFQEIFDKQMEDYRQKGRVDHPIDEVRKRRSMSQLEEVIIDDEDGSASLHDFLSDVVVDQSEVSPADKAVDEVETEDIPTLVDAQPTSSDLTSSEVQD